MSYVDYILNLGEIGYYIESYIASIFISPPADFFFVPLAIAKRECAIKYATIGFLLSVLGGISAYFLGKYGGRPIFNKLYKNKKALLKKYEISYKKHAFSIIFGAALFIAPYNVCSVASGILRADFKEFLLASILGRAIRFYGLLGAVYIWGESIREYLVLIGCFFGFVFIPILWIIETKRLKNPNET